MTGTNLTATFRNAQLFGTKVRHGEAVERLPLDGAGGG